MAPRTASGPCFFRSSPHNEALARLHYLVENGRQLGLLIGPSGSGRTVTLRAFAQEVGGAQVVLVQPTRSSSQHVLWQLADDLGTRPLALESPSSLWRRVTDRLSENHYQQLTTVILCDDAASVDFSVNELWQMLLKCSAAAGIGIAIVLALREEQIAWLGNDLLEQCDLRVELFPWCDTDIESYLEHRRIKERAATPPFDSRAIARICERTGGLPGDVVRLIDLCCTNKPSDVHSIGPSFIDQLVRRPGATTGMSSLIAPDVSSAAPVLSPLVSY